MNTDILDNECMTCTFYEPMMDESFGYCHRYPPTVQSRMAGVIAMQHPVVERNNVCGEWRQAGEE